MVVHGITYQSVEFQLHEYLVQIQDILMILNADECLLKQIEEAKELIKTKKYNIAVMGEFKRGKSSLINALLGYKILPADVEPATATINRITYGSELKAVIYYKNQKKEEIAIKQLSDYVTKISEKAEKMAASIAEACVYAPTPLCQNHVDIIDTPGLNDDADMTQVTISMLKQIDAVIVAIHAKAPFSQTEKQFVLQLLKSENIQNIIFVITFIDQLDEEEYDYQQFIDFVKNSIKKEIFQEIKKEEQVLMNKAHHLFDNLKIYGISSSLALKYFINNNKHDLQRSHFEQFKIDLMQIVTANQMENAVLKVTKSIQTLLPKLTNLYEDKLTRYKLKRGEINGIDIFVHEYCIDAPKRLAKCYGQNYFNIEQSINRLNQYKNQLGKRFIKALSSLRVNTHEAIRQQLQHCLYDSAEWMNQTILKDTKQTILATIWQIENTYNQERIAILSTSFSQLEIYDQFNISLEDKQAKDQQIINKLTFQWNVTFPNDLTKCDVMDLIYQAIDVSITRCIKQLTDSTNQSRYDFFSLMNEQAKSIQNEVNERIQTQYQAMELENSIYVNNYQQLSQTYQSIVDRCDELVYQLEKQKEEI